MTLFVSAESLSALDHIALIGNALPRRCGLATFTSHTHAALIDRFPQMSVDLYAMDDGGTVYSDDVRTIAADDVHAYRIAAGEIEASGAQAIWLQHEYGIFGGEAGSHILTLLDRTTLPVIVTLHTVPEQPSQLQREILDRLVARSHAVIVMAQEGRRLLRDVYDVTDAKISVIPHGVPDRPLIDTALVKARLGFAGRKLLLTFGLLAPDKGIDRMIAALPTVVAAHPDTLYVILGATHPNLLKREGEACRQALMAQAEKLGVDDHVAFVDSFVEQEMLLDYLQAADVYVTPYLKRDQVTSGTLSYAVAMGKPVVSTPYIHATEILADGHGVLVDFEDSHALAAAVGRLIGDDDARAALAARAYARGRTMLWSRSAEQAMTLLRSGVVAARRAPFVGRPSAMMPLVPSIAALRRMSDSTGIFQHAIHTIPDRRHGYCIDDNARALILINRVDAIDGEERDRWTSIFAGFIQHGWNPDKRAFRNFMRFDRSWAEDIGSEDSNGRALWALGTTVAEAPRQAHRDWALALFDEAASAALTFGSIRASAFAMLGACAVLSVHRDHGLAQRIVESAGDELLTVLSAARRPDWAWFEAVLAYDNARLPEALIRAGIALERDDYRTCGLESLAWICAQQTGKAGAFRPIGTDSFFRKYAAPLPFDQQPLEAAATVDACEAAFVATADQQWADEAIRAYRWYLGANDLSLSLASRADGGCFDGLMPHGLNRNQGAESILALHLASVTMARMPVTDKHLSKLEVAA